MRPLVLEELVLERVVVNDYGSRIGLVIEVPGDVSAVGIREVATVDARLRARGVRVAIDDIESGADGRGSRNRNRRGIWSARDDSPI